MAENTFQKASITAEAAQRMHYCRGCSTHHRSRRGQGSRNGQTDVYRGR